MSIRKRILYNILGDRQYSFLRVYAMVLFTCLKSKPVLFLHQMGKVGSSSIMHSLKRARYDQKRSVYRTHFLSNEGAQLLETLEKNGYGKWDNFPKNIKSMVVKNYVLGDLIRKGCFSRNNCKIITLVRDPIAVNISGFFQNYAWWPQELREKCKSENEVCLDNLIERFFNYYPHHIPLQWFDKELRNVFGINVFESPFPKHSGYFVYNYNRFKLLLIRLESLNTISKDVFCDFLKLPQFELIKANDASDKWYASLYKLFKRFLTIPEAYLHKMYDSQLVKHFYSAEEVNTFRKKWSKI